MLRPLSILFFGFQILTFSKLFSQSSIPNGIRKSFKTALFYSSSDIYLTLDKSYKPNVLNQKQLLIIDSIIQRVSDSLNLLITSTNIDTRKVDTLKHVFQIVSGKDKNDQKVIWVNAICNPAKDWNKRLMFVEDGGSCYYTFKINLNKVKYYNLQINASG